ERAALAQVDAVRRPVDDGARGVVRLAARGADDALAAPPPRAEHDGREQRHEQEERGEHGRRHPAITRPTTKISVPPTPPGSAVAENAPSRPRSSGSWPNSACSDATRRPA